MAGVLGALPDAGWIRRALCNPPGETGRQPGWRGQPGGGRGQPGGGGSRGGGGAVRYELAAWSCRCAARESHVCTTVSGLSDSVSIP